MIKQAVCYLMNTCLRNMYLNQLKLYKIFQNQITYKGISQKNNITKIIGSLVNERIFKKDDIILSAGEFTNSLYLQFKLDYAIIYMII